MDISLKTQNSQLPEGLNKFDDIVKDIQNNDFDADENSENVNLNQQSRSIHLTNHTSSDYFMKSPLHRPHTLPFKQNANNIKDDHRTYKFQVNHSFSAETIPSSGKNIEFCEKKISNDDLDKLVNVEVNEVYSRKVFVGGLPPDINKTQIEIIFSGFGQLSVDWPYKNGSSLPLKGFTFILFQSDASVSQLVKNCKELDNKLFLRISSETMKNKDVEIRPWRLSDADFSTSANTVLDQRKIIFVGGVSRSMKAIELASIMENMYGGVCYVGIETDSKVKYPKGWARVAFNNQKSFVSAISNHFIYLQHRDTSKRVEVKPYLHFDQMCDSCNGLKCSGMFAPYFCSNIMCLQYYCQYCWNINHLQSDRKYHKPVTKEFAPQFFSSFRRSEYIK